VWAGRKESEAVKWRSGGSDGSGSDNGEMEIGRVEELGKLRREARAEVKGEGVVCVAARQERAGVYKKGRLGVSGAFRWLMRLGCAA
jgi:hypothetical protein